MIPKHLTISQLKLSKWFGWIVEIHGTIRIEGEKFLREIWLGLKTACNCGPAQKKLRRQLHLTEMMQVWGENAGEGGGGEELQEDVHFHTATRRTEGRQLALCCAHGGAVSLCSAGFHQQNSSPSSVLGWHFAKSSHQKTYRKSGNVKGVLALERIVDLFHLLSCHPVYIYEE